MTETITLTTEAEARRFYGQRVWLLEDGERVRRTLLADARPVTGTDKTYGEYWNSIIIKANVNTWRQSLPITIEAS